MVRIGTYFLRVLPVLLIVSVALPACTASEDEADTVQGRLVHPVPEAIPGFAQARDFVGGDGNAMEGSQLRAVVQTLQSAAKAMTIGVLEGDEQYVLGRVADIEVDSDGNMYVLDSEFSEVRIYSPEGTFLFAVGGPGEGPGEFRSPRSLDLDPAGRILVADRTHEITVFERTGETYRSARAVPLPFEPNGMCVGNDALLVQGIAEDDSDVITRFSLSGEELGSFGESYETGSFAVRTFLTSGRLACTRQPESVMYFPLLFPAAYSYSFEGHMQWIVRLAGYEPLEMVQEGRGVSFNTLSSFDQVTAAVPVPEGYVILQIATTTEESRSALEGERHSELRTYLMSARTGGAVYVGSALPRIYAVTAEHMYTARTYPFPQVSVYRFARRLTGPAA